MIGIEFQPHFKAVEIVKKLHQRNLLTVPAGNSVARLFAGIESFSREREGCDNYRKTIVDLADKSERKN